MKWISFKLKVTTTKLRAIFKRIYHLFIEKIYNKFAKVRRRHLKRNVKNKCDIYGGGSYLRIEFGNNKQIQSS